MQQVSTVRSRDKALDLLLPKFFGILWAIGVSQGQIVKAIIDEQIELHAVRFRPDGILLSVYAPTKKSPVDKVLSAQFAADRTCVEPDHFRYQQGRCTILTWKRATWEDRIAAAPFEPRPLTDLRTIPIFIGALTRDSSETDPDCDLD